MEFWMSRAIIGIFKLIFREAMSAERNRLRREARGGEDENRRGRGRR